MLTAGTVCGKYVELSCLASEGLQDSILAIISLGGGSEYSISKSLHTKRRQ